MSSPQTRRRQRAPRLVVAAALVITAAVVVIGAVLSASVTWVSVAAVLAVVLGAAAVRITHSELMSARREAATDRARQAQGYRALTEQRSQEHRAFVSSMESRVGSAEEAVTQLESAVVASQGRAADSMRRLRAETRRADAAESEGSRLAVALEDSEERAAQAVVRVAELEDENGVLRTENDSLRSELDVATPWPQVKQA
jgi:mannitol-specific phosphotransferase system IIBC component